MTPTKPSDQIAALGRAIYDRDIRAQVEPDHQGEYIVIDVDHACWAMGASIREARAKLDQQRPDPESRNVYGLRVGSDVLDPEDGQPVSIVGRR